MDQSVNPFLNRRVAFQGKLGGMTLREAHALVRRLGGTPVKGDDPQVDLVVLGADELLEEGASNDQEAGVATLSETQLWQQLGLLEESHAVRRLYTPAMLADLLGVRVATIRRWHRGGLIHPQRTVHRLPYFAFEEIAVAKRLVELAQNGASSEEITARLQELNHQWPGLQRPLAELAVVVEGRQLLIKTENEIREPGGQKRFLWSEHETNNAQSDDGSPTIQLRPGVAHDAPHTSEQLIAAAEDLEEAGDIAAAADMYRAAIAAGGPHAQLCFQLAECLYRLNDLTAARERYAMAVELDDDYVEARANLGCVLAELGQTDLAIAAFEGALSLHGDYADAHYHLARLLAACGREREAETHRQRFEELAPASPWMEAQNAELGTRNEEL
jgi:tetratricopeptide (TPR) repeat protein